MKLNQQWRGTQQRDPRMPSPAAKPAASMPAPNSTSFYSPASTDEAASRAAQTPGADNGAGPSRGGAPPAFDEIIGGHRITIMGEPGQVMDRDQVMDRLRTQTNFRNTGAQIAAGDGKTIWNAHDDPAYHQALNPNLTQAERDAHAQAYAKHIEEMTPDGKKGIRGWTRENPLGTIAAMGLLAAGGAALMPAAGGAGAGAGAVGAAAAPGAVAAPAAGGIGAGATSAAAATGAALPEIVVTGTLGGGLTAGQVAALGMGAAGAGGAAAGSGSSSGMANSDPFSAGAFSSGGKGGMATVGQGNAGTLYANTGINTGGVAGVGGTGTGTGGLSSLGWKDYAKMGFKAMGGMGGKGSMPAPGRGYQPVVMPPVPVGERADPVQYRRVSMARAMEPY